MGVLGEGRGSTLVHLLVVVLSLVAFGFAVAAERQRSVGTMFRDERTNETYCIYNSDVATGYGVGSFLFLLSSESLLMGVTKCMCFGRPLTPGGNRAWSIIYFASSWVTFLVAESCLIAGATKNAYHTKYRGVIYAQNFSCETLRKGVFIAGAVFVVATMILNIYYYMYLTKATSTPTTHKANRSSSTVGMTGYA
ncbi:Fiber protein Fb34 [Quillaja saponaria]|uniref:Fiber protein Fb34 n=1 Tax=Quillaja saponaria TaxID=32244 RepID=A0AAD7KPA1_QUISA|nr:Fiber protein Fb34 [Quillaja saponaria]